MSWFGLGGSQKPSSPANAADNSFESFADNQASSNLPVSSLGNSQFEQQMLAEQQKALVQAMVFNLTQLSFEKCVKTPSSSLSSTERQCIHATTTKYMESTTHVIESLGPLFQKQMN